MTVFDPEQPSAVQIYCYASYSIALSGTTEQRDREGDAEYPRDRADLSSP
jgi:hypothetical protein